MLKKISGSFLNAWNGVRVVWREEFNFRVDCVLALIILSAALYFNFSFTELVAILFAIGLVLGAEIINTAIEDICDKVEPHHDILIGKIKDTSAAFVLVMALTSAVIGIIVFTHHFF